MSGNNSEILVPFPPAIIIVSIMFSPFWVVQIRTSLNWEETHSVTHLRITVA